MSRKFQVKAKYDYTGTEENRLSFEEGDLITVITQLDSGWWNGISKGNRGWFPSNYVAVADEPLNSNSLERRGSTNVYSANADSLSSPFIEQSFIHNNPSPLPNSNYDSTQQRPMTPISAGSEGGFNLMRSAAVLQFEANVPANWIKKFTPDGRIYFYNVQTNESSWYLQAIDPVSGELKKNENENLMNWNLLLDDVLLAVNNLSQQSQNFTSNPSTTTVQIGHVYIQLSSAIVESIRIMLYASGTANRDPLVFKENKTLKNNHKHLMNSLQKLVVSAKLASSQNVTPESFQTMQQACTDVSLSIRHFVAEAIKFGVQINNLYHEQLTQTPSPRTSAEFNRRQSTEDTTILTQQLSNAGLISLLEKYTKSVVKMISQLMKNIRNNHCGSTALISDVRIMVTEVGKFLELVDEIPIDMLSEEMSIDFKVNRLSLYNSISGLVMATQTATSPLAPANPLNQVILSSGLVEKAVKDLLISTKFLIEEKTAVEEQQLVSAAKMREEEDRNIGQTRSKTPTRGRTLSLTALKISKNSVSSSPSYGDLRQIVEEGGQQQARFGRISENAMNGGGQSVSAGAVSAPYKEFLNGEVPMLSPGKNKLKQFFGEVPAPQKTEEVDMSFLGYEFDAADDILINMEGKVKGGTLNALVERLTPHDYSEPKFVQTFLLTYRSFTTSTELFELLKKRYCLTPDPSLTPEQLIQWKEKKEITVRLRVFNVIKSWIETYCENNPEDLEVLQEIKLFASTTMSESISNRSQQLIKMVDAREQPGGGGRMLIPNLNNNCPPPILPRNMKKLKVLEIDPLEMARQLTILDSKDFNKIQPVECLKKAWSDKESNISPNIKNITRTSNLISAWVAQSILLCKDIKTRGAYIKHFILIAEKCRSLNNFNTLMSILSGLNSAPIHRLKRAFELLSKNNHETLKNLQNLMTSTKNFSQYREALKISNPPAIPFLACYLTDLTFIEDGNPDLLKNNNNMINFNKRAKTADTIRLIQQYQNVPYQLTPVKEMQSFITEECLMESLDESEMYNLSLQLEPREREDEKIARLLEESGFL